MSGALPSVSGALLKDGILLFWALWISIVVLANVVDALGVAGVLPSDARLASGNFRAVARAGGRLGIPRAGAFLVYVGIIIWELLAAALLWRGAVMLPADLDSRYRAADTGLAALLALFAAFMLADEIVHEFRMETDHRSIALLILISLLALHLLPG